MSVDSHIIRFSLGRGRSLAKAKNKALPWSLFCKQFKTPVKTGERFRDYLKLPHEEQVALKGTNGWFYRTQIDGERRNRSSGKPSDLITLDFDYATPEFIAKIEAGEILPGTAFLVHSSRRHTDEKPRIRMMIPVAEPIENDTYGAVSRIVCQLIDPEMRMVDLVSFRPAQMMFMPTTSKDGDWFFHQQDGSALACAPILEDFSKRVGDWRDYKNLPTTPHERLRERADKAENPTEKKGVVGDFCRAYDVPAAIEKFLPDVYEPVHDGSAKPRYTYLGGTTTNGAVVEDDGLFLYSHHGSDPCGDQLVNAFDLVRIHKFGKQDEKIDPETPVVKLPSFAAMIEFCQSDPGFRAAALESRYDIAAAFDDIEEDDGDPAGGGFAASFDDPEIDDLIGTPGTFDDPEIDDLIGTPPKAKKADRKANEAPKPEAPADWMKALDLTQDGFIKLTLPNLIHIIRFDPRINGAIAYNDFTGRVVLRRSIRPKSRAIPKQVCRDPVNGTRWDDKFDVTLRAILESPSGDGGVGYGLRVPVRDLTDACVGAALYNRFHPIREMLEGLEWDGVPRIERMGETYFGAELTPYVREIFRLKMVASVARIYEPGHKFDNAIILEGPQGAGKSTFIKVLYGDEYFCEVDCDLDDKARVVETISGKWAGELPELGALHKSDFNAAKAFMRRQFDDVRLAFGRSVGEHPRQTVFWGTTNEVKYLKDPTGNRSFWPLRVAVESIDLAAVRRDKGQLWAEAVHLYRQARAEQPHGSLNLDLSPAAKALAVEKQEDARPEDLFEDWAERIRAWADEPILLSSLFGQYGLLTEKFGEADGLDPETTWVVRTVWRQDDALEYALGLKPTVASFVQKQLLERAYSALPEWVGSKHAMRRFGLRARWRRRKEASAEDVQRGYRVVPSPGTDDFDNLI